MAKEKEGASSANPTDNSDDKLTQLAFGLYGQPGRLRSLARIRTLPMRRHPDGMGNHARSGPSRGSC